MAIIGAGPVGLFCASFSYLHGLKTIIFDSLAEAGGQPKLLYPFKKIKDIPAFKEISASNLINRLEKDAQQKATFILNHRVTTIKKVKNKFVIDNTYTAKSVIIATGTGAFSPKKLPVKTNKECDSKIHYYVKEPQKMAHQQIGVFGGGDSALDWALELSSQPGTNIKLIHRRNEFRGLESSVKELKNLKNVEILTPYLPKAVQIRNNQLDIELKKMGSNDIIRKQFDQIIVAYGFRANNQFVKEWGVNLINNQIEVSPEMETNISGIYAIGDVATYSGRVPLIGLGFGEAQIAINSIMRSLFPEKTLTIHSTSI